MGKAIDQTARRHFANTPKVIGIDLVDVAAFELCGAIRHAIEHLIVAIQKMNGPEHKIELLPMFLNPVSTSCRMNRVVVELDPSADPQIRIFFAQTIDFAEIYTGVITV